MKIASQVMVVLVTFTAAVAFADGRKCSGKKNSVKIGLCLFKEYNIFMRSYCQIWCSGFSYLAKVIEGVKFRDGIEVKTEDQGVA